MLGCDNSKDYVSCLSRVAADPLYSDSLTLIEGSSEQKALLPHEIRTLDVKSLPSVFESIYPSSVLPIESSHLIDKLEPTLSQRTISNVFTTTQPVFSPDRIPTESPEKKKEKIQNWVIDTSNRRPSDASSNLPSPALVPTPSPANFTCAKPHEDGKDNDLIARDGNWWVESNRVHLNINGERIDLDLPSCDDRLISKWGLMEQRPCVSTYLTGECVNGVTCPYWHPIPDHPDPAFRLDLEYQDLLALKHWQRRLCCYSGLKCRKPKCLMGHNCPKQGCMSSKCVFEKSHGIDRTVIKILS